MKANPRHLILNLLLGTDGGSMTARAAVAACALFGIRENSVRVALARLAAAGLVESTGRGAYRLGPRAVPLAEHVATWRGAQQRVRRWGGGWIAVHAGNLGRSDRAALRARQRALELLGMRELDRGLYLRPDNLDGGVAAVRERLLELGLQPEAATFVAHDLDPGREMRARTLWDGVALTKAYRDTRRRLDHWLAGAGSLEPRVAARQAFQLGNDAIRQLVFDPLLPAPLVDEQARAAFVTSVVRFDAAGKVVWKLFQQEHPK